MAKRASRILMVFAGALLVAMAGCSGDKKPASNAAAENATRITAIVAPQRTVQVIEPSVGRLESLTAPQISAEVDGRVLGINADIGQQVTAGQPLLSLEKEKYQLALRAADADVSRLTALLANQKRTVRRYQKLIAEKTISANQLDEAKAQQTALDEQLKGAQAQRDRAARDLANTDVTAPLAGLVDERLVAVGDYVRTGTPLFRIADINHLRARLPFPETLADKFAVGQTVRLATPVAPDKVVTGQITDIRPMVGSSSRALEVIVDLPNPGGWQPGASVKGEVILAEHPGAVVVPETSVVRRPAGEVVYVINGNTAHQRLVTLGVRSADGVEIRTGLKAGERIAVNGAGYLTEGAPVAVEESQ